jgi:hypothetical protein
MPSLLRLARRRTDPPSPERRSQTGPLPMPVAARIRLSADLLASLLEVEQRSRATLDDIEWADAVADRLIRRQLRRQLAGRAAGPSAYIAG